MLKTFQWTALIAAIVLIVAVAGAIVSSQPSLGPAQQQASEKNYGKEHHEKGDITLWDSWFPDSTSIFNLFLVVFTGVLAFAGIFQLSALNRAERISANIAQAAKDSSEVAKQSLVTVQRAFVFVDLFQADMLNNELIVMPRWRNSGTTPTRYMTNWANWKHFISEPPDDFAFPDLDEGGTPVDEKDKKPQLAFVGPNATTFAHVLTIPNAVLGATRTSQARVFVWGWAKYQDVFKTDHVTKFCNEIKILASWTQGEKIAAAISFPIYRRHNCTDEECDGEK
jgi:hypothetical protein